MITEEMEQYRIKDAPFISGSGQQSGMFRFEGLDITIFSADPDWEHCTVSTTTRCPTWDEMCKVKNLIWGECVTVVQYHPNKEAYVNLHPFALHMWRNSEGHELPDLRMVYSGRTTLEEQ